MTTNLAFQITDENKKDVPWEYLVKEISKVFKFTRKETKQFAASKTAKLIASIPFEADCYEPEKTAIAHLGLYVMEKRGFQEYCSHQPIDDVNILHRLDFISTFEGGDPEIIEHGMYLLALIMLEGYNNSIGEDIKNEVYNPIASGRWNYELKKKEIMSVLKKVECPNLDFVFLSSYQEFSKEW